VLPHCLSDAFFAQVLRPPLRAPPRALRHAQIHPLPRPLLRPPRPLPLRPRLLRRPDSPQPLRQRPPPIGARRLGTRRQRQRRCRCRRWRAAQGDGVCGRSNGVWIRRAERGLAEDVVSL